MPRFTSNKSWHFTYLFICFICLFKDIYLLKANEGFKVVEERTRWKGGQRWICRSDSKEFEFHSTFSGKPDGFQGRRDVFKDYTPEVLEI